MESQLRSPVGQFDGSGEFLHVVLKSSFPSLLPGQMVNLILTATKMH